MDEEFVTVLDTANGFETEFIKTFLVNNGFEVRESNGTPRPSGVSNKLLQVPVKESERAFQFIENLRNAKIVYDENFPAGSDEFN
jgi:hypothetical protein